MKKNWEAPPYDDGKTHIGKPDSAQPLIFRRKQKDIPDLLVYYTFTKKDSLVSEVLYEWDVSNFEKNSNNPKPTAFNKAMIAKYNELENYITSKYGKGTTEGSLENLAAIDTDDGLKEKDIWQPNDSLKLKMYISVSNYYNKRGIVTSPTTHIIRLYVDYITPVNNKNEKPIDTAALDKSFRTFLSYLANENYEGAKTILSEKIRNGVTIEALKQIKPNMERELEIYMSGMEFLQDGNSYNTLQYKFTDDTASPPKEVIKVIFDSDNTLLGIQPMKRE